MSSEAAAAIQTYDMVTNTVIEFEPCRAIHQTDTYIESRRQVIILGEKEGVKGVRVFGFNVDTRDVVPYTTVAVDQKPHTSLIFWSTVN